MLYLLKKLLNRFRKPQKNLWADNGHSERRVAAQERRRRLTHISPERRSGADRRKNSYKYERMLSQHLQPKDMSE